MSNLVEQINDSLTSILATEAGAGYEELDYIINISKNAWDRNKDRYGVRPLDASTAAGVTNVYTLDHDFEIILTSEYVNSGVDDVDQREKTFVLYDKMDEFYKAAYLRKAGLPSIVLYVSEIDMDEPEYLEDNQVVVLRASVTIKYRNAINS